MTTVKTTPAESKPPGKSPLSSSSSSSSSSDSDDGSDTSSDSDSSSVASTSKTSSKQSTDKQQQFSVMSSDSAGLRMKIAIPRNQSNSTPTPSPSGGSGPTNRPGSSASDVLKLASVTVASPAATPVSPAPPVVACDKVPQVETPSPAKPESRTSARKGSKSDSSSDTSSCYSNFSDTESDSSSSENRNSGGKKDSSIASGTKKQKFVKRKKTNRSVSTSSTSGSDDSSDSDSSSDENQDESKDLSQEARVPSTSGSMPLSTSTPAKSPPPPPTTVSAIQTSSTIPDADAGSSSDNDLPALVNAAILRVAESGSDGESCRGVPSAMPQYTSSLLRDFVAKTAMLGSGGDSSEPNQAGSSTPAVQGDLHKIKTESPVPGGANSVASSSSVLNVNGVSSKPDPTTIVPIKRRGRPPKSVVNPVVVVASTTTKAPTPTVSESPDSGILSTHSSVGSPKTDKKVVASGSQKRRIEPEPCSSGVRSKSPAVAPLNKYTIASLDRNTYATERVLYPPRGKKKTGRAVKDKHSSVAIQSIADDNLDPLWKKIDISKKFHEPNLSGYKSDGGHSTICCSKQLASQSGYISDYGGGHRRSRLSGYKSDCSVKSRKSCGYKSDYSVKAKSCGYRSDCSTRHRKQVRRKRRKKLAPNNNNLNNKNFNQSSKSSSVSEQDILQLAGLTLGSTSEESSSSQESLSSINTTTPFSKALRISQDLSTSKSTIPSLLTVKNRVNPLLPINNFKGIFSSLTRFGNQDTFSSNLSPKNTFAAFLKNNRNKDNGKVNARKLPLSKANVIKNAEECVKRFQRSTSQDLLSRITNADIPKASPAKSVCSKRSRRKSIQSDKVDNTSVKSCGTIRQRRMSTMSRCSSRSAGSRHPWRKKKRKRLRSNSVAGGKSSSDIKMSVEIERLTESFCGQCRISLDAKAKDGVLGVGAAALAGAAAKNQQKGRSTKKRKASEHVESPSTTAAGTKRRNKKSVPTQSPDDHKLPLKKRHYLLSEQTSKGNDSGAEKEDPKSHAVINPCATVGSRVTPSTTTSTSFSSSMKDPSKVVTPKKRHLLKSPEPIVPEEIVQIKSSDSPLTVDPKTAEGATTETTSGHKKSDAITRKKNRLEGLVSKIQPTATVTAILADNNILAATNHRSTPPSRPSVIQSSSTTTTAAATPTTVNAPPPGVFEPTVDLELAISTSIPSLVAKVELLDSPRHKDSIAKMEGDEAAKKNSEKLLEKLLTKTGAHLLLKKKRKKPNRTGFPTVKKKKKKSIDKEPSEEEHKPEVGSELFDSSNLTRHVPTETEKVTKEKHPQHPKESSKNCDRVPKEGEPTDSFIERNTRPRLSVVSLERLQGKIPMSGRDVVSPSTPPATGAGRGRKSTAAVTAAVASATVAITVAPEAPPQAASTERRQLREKSKDKSESEKKDEGRTKEKKLRTEPVPAYRISRKEMLEKVLKGKEKPVEPKEISIEHKAVESVPALRISKKDLLEKVLKGKEKAAEVRQKSVELKQKSVETKQKPVEPKQKPFELKEKPVESKQKPVEHKQRPVDSKQKLGEPKEKPVEPKQRPVEPKEKPVERKHKALELNQKPLELNQKPIELKEKPVERKQKPVETKEKPVEARQKLMELKEKPSETKQKPIEPKEKLTETNETPMESREKTMEPKQKHANLKQKQSEPKAKPAELREKPTELKEKPREPKDQLPEPEEKPAEPKEKPVESKEKPVESKEKPVASKENPTEPKEKPVDRKERPVERKQMPLESKDKPAELKEKHVEAKEKPVERKNNLIERKDKLVETEALSSVVKQVEKPIQSLPEKENKKQGIPLAKKPKLLSDEAPIPLRRTRSSSIALDPAELAKRNAAQESEIVLKNAVIKLQPCVLSNDDSDSLDSMPLLKRLQSRSVSRQQQACTPEVAPITSPKTPARPRGRPRTASPTPVNETPPIPVTPTLSEQLSKLRRSRMSVVDVTKRPELEVPATPRAKETRSAAARKSFSKEITSGQLIIQQQSFDIPPVKIIISKKDQKAVATAVAVEKQLEKEKSPVPAFIEEMSNERVKCRSSSRIDAVVDKIRKVLRKSSIEVPPPPKLKRGKSDDLKADAEKSVKKLKKDVEPIAQEVVVPLVPVDVQKFEMKESVTQLSKIQPASSMEDLEHDPLPAEEGPPDYFRAETTPSPPADGKYKKVPRKKYITAGLFSDCYKDDGKGSGRSGPKIQPESLLPPPAYCEKFLRRTQRDFQLPYDLWWLHENGKMTGRHAVPSWNYRKIRTNVYYDVKPNPSSDHPQCNCKPDSGCQDDCLNRLVYVECMTENCPCGDRCQNTKIQRHEYAPGLERFMTEQKGWGIRSKEVVKKGSFIMEYLGEVVTEKEFKERMRTIYINDTHHYCLNLTGGLVIDGHRMGSDCRFVNHSCAPNCEMQKWSVNGLFRMALFASRDVPPHEELSYDYNFSLFNPSEGQPCMCGAEQCRGVIGGKYQRVKPLPVASEAKKQETAATTANLTAPSTEQSPRSAARSRKRQAKKNAPLTQLNGQPLPNFVTPTVKERALIVEHHCFLMRNLNKIRKLKERSPEHSSSSQSASPALGANLQAIGVVGKPSLASQMSALRCPRNIRTRGLAFVEDDPELEKAARIAVALKEICIEIASLKDERGHLYQNRLILPSKKKVPLYYERVPRPIDLAQIQGNIEQGTYKQPKIFEDDLLIMFSNAVKYYGISSPEGTASEKLKEHYYICKQRQVDKLIAYVGEQNDLLKGFVPKTEPEPVVPVKGRGKFKQEQVEDIIRCICGLFKDEGLMIQCSKCLVWQHIECTKANPDVDNYHCEKCEPRQVPYEIPLNEYTEEGYQYYISLMRGSLQIRQTDTVYVLRDIPMSPDPNNPNVPARKHTYETIGKVDYAECDIFRVESLWKDKEGRRFVYGHHYLRPHETYHEPTRRFYPNEVMRVPLYEVIPIELVIDRCWVLDPTTFCKGRPVDSSEPHVYICELRVDKSARLFSKISRHTHPVCMKTYAFHKFEEKLKISKTFAPHDLGSLSHLLAAKDNRKKPTKKDDANSSISTISSVASTKKMTPVMQLLPPPPKTLAEKRNRLEGVLGRLLLKLNANPAAQPVVDISYLLTGRGARLRRTIANATPVPII